MRVNHAATNKNCGTGSDGGCGTGKRYADVLQRIDRHPAKRVIELTPRVWKELFAENPLRSDLDRVRDPPAH